MSRFSYKERLSPPGGTVRAAPGPTVDRVNEEVHEIAVCSCGVSRPQTTSSLASVARGYKDGGDRATRFLMTLGAHP
jgi:hypothetical protein